MLFRSDAFTEQIGASNEEILRQVAEENEGLKSAMEESDAELQKQFEDLNADQKDLATQLSNQGVSLNDAIKAVQQSGAKQAAEQAAAIKTLTTQTQQAGGLNMLLSLLGLSGAGGSGATAVPENKPELAKITPYQWHDIFSVLGDTGGESKSSKEGDDVTDQLLKFIQE